MHEITALVMFLLLAFGLGIAALMMYGGEYLVMKFLAWRRSRASLKNMPARIRRLNSKMFG